MPQTETDLFRTLGLWSLGFSFVCLDLALYDIEEPDLRETDLAFAGGFFGTAVIFSALSRFVNRANPLIVVLPVNGNPGVNQQ